MDLTSTVAASRLAAQERAMEVVAGNLANMDTPGFKAERVQFSDWLDRQADGSSVAYTQDRATWRENAPGPLRHTGNPLDLAITGDGYFTVATAQGPRLTRDGRFGVMPNGTIADASGDALLDTSGRPIRIGVTDTDLTITGDGSLSSENGRIAAIGVVRPQDPMQVVAEGGTRFQANTPTLPVTSRQIVQGAVEGSNVQPIAEVTRMIDGERMFQFLAQFVQAESDRQKMAIEKILPTAAG